ncbi:hypothetical protein J6590_016682 [Homalodisca vitripennis]|nr:hypothetical protein J6590_016682 [Homalodisca vitripennis]
MKGRDQTEPTTAGVTHQAQTQQKRENQANTTLEDAGTWRNGGGEGGESGKVKKPAKQLIKRGEKLILEGKAGKVNGQAIVIERLLSYKYRAEWSGVEWREEETCTAQADCCYLLAEYFRFVLAH